MIDLTLKNRIDSILFKTQQLVY